MSIFDIDPDIARASTLSAEFYTDERYFAESRDKIFARSWQLAARASEVDNLAPATVLESFLDEPVLFARENESLHCLANVCTHRGKLLVEENCRAGGIRCGYHGRRFALDGRFLSMPEFDGVQDFPSEADNLPKIPAAALGDLLFVSVAPRASFEEVFAPVVERLAWVDWSSLKFSAARSRDYFVDAHWALYCENYLEGFHIPFVHQSLNAVVDYDSYTTETFRFASLQTGRAKSGDDAFDFDESVAALYFFVFPNLMLNFYPWGLSVNVVKPLRKDLTKVSYLTYVADESKLDRGAGADLGRVEYEDQRVVEAVQKGINSRFYDRGRYSPSREQGTHHFHRLIAEFMK
ncbi:MAG: Rieske 2Fe-2S domain-containing protein [Acidobacteria bacterium]|nr:Rieske 2Fe-2S domain-containing protein [Acidobacteriota bacterium]